MNQLPPSFFIMPGIILVCMLGMFWSLRRSAQKRKEKERGRSTAFPERPRAVGMQAPEARASGGGIARISSTARKSQAAAAYADVAQPDLDMLVANERSSSGVQQPAPAAQDNSADALPLEHDWLAALSSISPEPSPSPAPAPSPRPAPVVNSTRRASGPDDMVEVMRVYRTLTDGKLVVQIGDQRYRSVGEMRDPDMAQRFSDAAQELQAMTGNVPGSRLKSIAGNVVAASKAASAPAPQAAPVGIVSAIEDFLQFKLASNPQLATRSIHIKPGQNQGVRIEVDNHSYDGIGDVVDPDVREFLFGVMREWDARH